MKYYYVDETDSSLVEDEGSAFDCIAAILQGIGNILWLIPVVCFKIWLLYEILKAIFSE